MGQQTGAFVSQTINILQMIFSAGLRKQNDVDVPQLLLYILRPRIENWQQSQN